MAAVIIRTVDQETANATGAHLSEGDLLAGESGHAPFKRARSKQAYHPRHWARSEPRPLPVAVIDDSPPDGPLAQGPASVVL